MNFVVGNRHCLAAENEIIVNKRNPDYNRKHKWTAFVTPENENLKPNLHKLISKIHIGLHEESFGRPYKEIVAAKGKPIEWTHIAYGWFESPITIFWTKAAG